MRRVAVTGPIGSGKSALTGILAAHGAATVLGDQLGHEVLRDVGVVARIARDLGPQYIVDGQVDRPALGDLVFGDVAALGTLNAITHPVLALLAETRLAELDRAGNHELAVFEAAVYFLLPAAPRVDLVVAVLAAPEVRAVRLAARDGLSTERIKARILAQAPMDADWSRADLVLDNDGTWESLELGANEILARIGLRH